MLAILFMMYVYTVDFNDEGGAWHASRLHAQADFVVATVEKLAEQCGGDNSYICHHIFKYIQTGTRGSNITIHTEQNGQCWIGLQTK